MHGLNNSVISGKCPSCLIYEERVAHLEGGKAAKDVALRDMVAIAAERLIQFPADGYFRQLYDIGGAALSDEGEGWLPPEKVELVAARLRSASRVFHSEQGHAWSWPECKHLQCVQDRAALAALKGE